MFLCQFLALKELPNNNYFELEVTVKEDLKDIGLLIDYYESTDEFKELTSNRNVPRNHRQKIIIDYYDRCKAQQKLILNYFLNDLLNRAIDKSLLIEFKASWHFIYEQFYDRPYEW